MYAILLYLAKQSQSSKGTGILCNISTPKKLSKFCSCCYFLGLPQKIVQTFNMLSLWMPPDDSRYSKDSKPLLSTLCVCSCLCVLQKIIRGYPTLFMVCDFLYELTHNSVGYYSCWRGLVSLMAKLQLATLIFIWIYWN